MAFSEIMGILQNVLHSVAEITVVALEFIGISIIIIGSIKALAKIITQLRKKQPINIMIDLGRALALALEFKMGAEIVNTVIIRELKELIILGMVIALRAILAILIHWEMRNEKLESEETKKNEEKTKNKNAAE